jgi:hypothetical protein
MVDLSNPAEKLKAKNLLRVLQNKEQLRDWYRAYFGIEMVGDTIDPDSNSNPLDAAWQIYEAVRDNKGEEVDGFIMLSAREAYKTLSAAMLEVLLLLHFQVTISHMAAILKQSDKAVAYITSFLNKLKPYIDYNGWKQVSESKTMLEFQTPEGHRPYILVVVCSMAGANGPHTNLMFVDEIDVIRDPVAYEESKLIPGMERGRLPITVKLSTRKFAFGLMEKELNDAKETGEKILRWNIIDIAEKCQPSRFQPNADGSRITAYVAKKLPLTTITPAEFEAKHPQEKADWEKVEAHPGCLGCKLLPVCKTRLADKPESSVKNLYKPIAALLKSFKKVSPDMAEAQLMCWKPSSKGLVYPRFDTHKNVLSVDQALELLTGDKVSGASFDELIQTLKKLEARFYAGVDWGYTHEATIVVMAVTSSGYSLIVETFGSPGLEIHDFKMLGLRFQEKYGISKWFYDQASPSNIKTFTKAGMKGPEFTKDVLGGIEAIRSQIVDTMGQRRLFVINTEENRKIIQGFKVHHFKLDNAGNPTKHPDDEEFADVMDSLRYIGQNVHGPKNSNKIIIGSDNPQEGRQHPTMAEQLSQEIRVRVVETGVKTEETVKKKRGLIWDM